MPEEIAKLVEEFAEQQGLKAKREGRGLSLYYRDSPVYIRVEETSRGVKVSLAHRGLEDYVREVVGEEENPQEYLEELLDDLSSLAARLARKLESKGYKTILETREAVIDALEALEEELEEE